MVRGVKNVLRTILCSIMIMLSSSSSAKQPEDTVIVEGSQKYLLKDDDVQQQDYLRELGAAQAASNQSKDIQYRPVRVRISPFDLSLSPTQVQLTRADEDILLLKLQDLLTLFISASQPANDRTLEYILFSDVQRNSWIHSNREPQSILRLNGGVASFMGDNVPTLPQLNEWVEEVVNTLLVPSLNASQYSYLSKAMYVTVGQAAAGQEQEVVEEELSHVIQEQPVAAELEQPVAVEQEQPGVVEQEQPVTVVQPPPVTAVEEQPAAVTEGSPQNGAPPPVTTTGQQDNFGAIIGALVAVGVVLALVLLSIFRARRSDKIHHTPNHPHKNRDSIIKAATSAEAEEIEFSVEPSFMQDPNHAEDMSLYSGASQSEWTLSSFSTALRSTGGGSTVTSSFYPKYRNSRGKPPMFVTESFQKERPVNLQKDMMYSTWSGVAPNIGKSNRGESVLKPSHITAAQEKKREDNSNSTNDVAAADASSSANVDNTKDIDRMSNHSKKGQQVQLDVVDDESSPFVFEQAHEREDEYVVQPSPQISGGRSSGAQSDESEDDPAPIV